MQTFLNAKVRESPEGKEADRILRSCVHCGFCNATCPTYQLLGDERDGPRGRIYLIKQMLENGSATRETQRHLDRCLSCRSCETTCPSGVEYGRLLDIGRSLLESQVQRPLTERLQRQALLRTVPHPGRFKPLARLAGLTRAILPAALKKSIPTITAAPGPWPSGKHERRVLLLEGCVQSVLGPRTNLAAARILDRLGIQAVPAPGCCGALSHHLSAEEQTIATIRANIDRWWPEIDSGAEAVVLTASGCAPVVRDYGYLLQGDPDYADKARQLASMALDISEYLEKQDLGRLGISPDRGRLIAFHSPCTLQHGLKRAGNVEALLLRLGFRLASIPDEHLCCGSAGSYSILQPDLSQKLLKAKLENLERNQPAIIATANIGCQMHLQSGTDWPVKHWVELLT